MKKKSLVMVLVLTLCMSLFTACGTKADETAANGNAAVSDGDGKSDQSFQYIKNKGELVLGLDDQFPPMGFVNENQEIVGFDIDVAKAVCEKLGVKLKLQPISWEAKEQELATKNIDCIWNGFSKNPEREKNLTLSTPYMKNKQVAVVLADSTVVTLSDLKGKKVVIQNGSTASDAIDANEAFKTSLGELILVEDNIKALMDMKIKASDAVVMDEVVARYYSEKNQGQFKILNETLSEEDYVIGFRKGDAELCNSVNAALSELAKDGSLKKISETWFGKDITSVQ